MQVAYGQFMSTNAECQALWPYFGENRDVWGVFLREDELAPVEGVHPLNSLLSSTACRLPSFPRVQMVSRRAWQTSAGITFRNVPPAVNARAARSRLYPPHAVR